MNPIAGLRDRLLAAGYRADAVLARLGSAGQQGLARNTTIAAKRALGADRDRQATLIRLFCLAAEVPLADARAALPVAGLVAAGLVQIRGDRVRAEVDIRPYAFELPGGGQWDGWVVCDRTPGLDHDLDPVRPDFVLNASPASTTLAQLTIPDQVASALDLGTGCGVQSLHLATHAARIVATDINPRARRLARMTFELNRLPVEVRAGSLYEPVAGERFDLIVANPPFVIGPVPDPAGRLLYRDGGLPGDELVRRVVQGAGARLRPGGTAQLLANWAITAEPVADRLAAWAPAGADLWVIERERLDPYAYIELWLADAGLNHTPEWASRYGAWLDQFDRLGIQAVGMGWITVVDAGRVRPEFCYERWTHEVAQPVGAALANRHRAVGWAGNPDTGLLATNWLVAPDVVQETLGRPGAADPQHIVFRQTSGLCRARQVGTELAGVVGACDGTMSLATIIDAVARLLDQEPGQLRRRLLGDLRELIVDGYLRPV